MKFNKLCELEDWAQPEMAETMRRLMPDLVESCPRYPFGFEHRKVWEYAQVLIGLERRGMLRADAFVLSVGSGQEAPLYDLTNRVRWVFATDIYGEGQFHDRVAPANMLIDPGQHARSPYNRNRLVVQHMSALDLRFEPATFNVVYSFSTIEHLGRLEHVMRALSEINRVLKPGGIAAITTECVVNGAPQLECEGLILFEPSFLEALDGLIPGFQLIEQIDFSISKRTVAQAKPLKEVLAAWNAGRSSYPQVVEEYEGRLFTSVCMFFRKEPDSQTQLDHHNVASGH